MRLPSHREGLTEALRGLNRAPFVLGVFFLLIAALGVAVLVLGGWSWYFASMGLVSAMSGVGLVVLYYRLHRYDQ
jgi:hypothetical protein